jgi:5-methylcytosine-specific restriction endonuclease McrA
MTTKKQVREKFRKAVFERDNNTCKIPNCNKPCVDAHHIINRDKIHKGGYVAANGVSLCSDCHLKAEKGEITEAYLFMLINSNAGHAHNESVRLL